MSKEKYSNEYLHVSGFLTSAKTTFYPFPPESSTIASGGVNTILFITVSVFHGQT